jgi:outer membrane receptor protein involved in Fe transport
VFGYSVVTGAGRRSRYATTAELRLPILKVLSFTTSGRYDDYRVSGQTVDKATFNVGVELRPLETLTVRGRYGTAFKAPTLPEEFQGKSTFYTTSTDYYQCALAGYTGTNIGNCPYAFKTIYGGTSGNPQLQSITAKTWDVGMVWAPVDRMSISADYLHWAINNEVSTQSADQLLKTESLCRGGTYDITTPTCTTALSQVIRDPQGMIVSVFLPRINISQETVNAITTSIDYRWSVGRFGNFVFEASWSDMLKHTYQQYPGDPIVDELRDSTWSTDFKSKVNTSLTWSTGHWSSTVYVNRDGRSPNFLANVYGYGTPGASTLPPWTLYNFTTRFQWNPALRLSLVIDNAFDSMPPADHSYPGYSSSPYNETNYNIYGRSYYLQATYNFGQ